MDGSQFVSPRTGGGGISAANRVHATYRCTQSLRGISALIVLIGLGIYGRYYWTIGRFLVSTDDATVAADSVIISPKVSGYLSEVLVDDNQAVHAGQTLARIDDRDYRTALAGAQANVASAQAAIDDLEQKIAQQRISIVQAQAVVSTDQAALAFSQQQFGRYSGLARTGAATGQDSQQWQTDQREKEAALSRDTAAVGVAQKQIDVFGAELPRLNTARRAEVASSSACEPEVICWWRMSRLRLWRRCRTGTLRLNPLAALGPAHP